MKGRIRFILVEILASTYGKVLVFLQAGKARQLSDLNIQNAGLKEKNV